MNLYTDLAQQFSDSREFFQPGWENLCDLELPTSLKVLDLGCGDARFYKFLKHKFPAKRLAYTGLDSSSELLQLASRTGANKLVQGVLPDLTKDSIKDLQSRGPYNLVVIYAVMHHLFDYAERLKTLKLAYSLLESGGYLHVSFWQFGEYPRYQHKLYKDIGLLSEYEQREVGMLHQDDYIMDWHRGGVAYRFCHWTKIAEIEKIEAEIAARRILDYRSDGKEGDQNWYFLWQK